MYHYKEGNVNYPMGIYIVLVHIVAVVGLLKIPDCSVHTWMWAFVLWPIRWVNALRAVCCVLPPLFRTTSHIRSSFVIVGSELPLGYIAYGHIDLTRLHSQPAFSLCSVTPLPTRDQFTTGLGIIESITSIVRLMLTPTMLPAASFSLTWDGCWWRSTLMWLRLAAPWTFQTCWKIHLLSSRRNLIRGSPFTCALSCPRK